MKLSRALILASVAALALVAGPDSSARTKPRTSATIRGEVVDLMCYLADTKKKGRAHEACAREGIVSGNPVGILTKSGELYLVIGKNSQSISEMFAPHAAKQVEVTGRRISKARMLAILAEKVERL